MDSTTAVKSPLLGIGYHKIRATRLQKCVFRNAWIGCSFVTGAEISGSALISSSPIEADPEITCRDFESSI